MIELLLLLLNVVEVVSHGAFVSINSQPYKAYGTEGYYGSRNWRTHRNHHSPLSEWDPYSLAGQGGRQDPIVGSESSWADIACGEPGQTQHSIQYNGMSSDWMIPGNYEPNSQIQFDIKITANHGGIFEFRHFCADTKISEGKPLSYLDFYDIESSLSSSTTCHNANPESNIFYNGNCYVPRNLQRVTPSLSDKTYFVSRPEHFILSQDATCHDNALTNVGSDLTFGIKYVLPSETCEHEIIQWWWQTSNNCYFNSWKEAINNQIFPCKTASWPVTSLADCVPGGDKATGGEQFVNCLDLSLGTTVVPGPGGGSPAPAPSPNVNGGWTAYGLCSASCGTGTQSRTCTNPSPQGNCLF
jgi:hypothetical protein